MLYIACSLVASFNGDFGATHHVDEGSSKGSVVYYHHNAICGSVHYWNKIHECVQKRRLKNMIDALVLRQHGSVGRMH